MIKVPKERSLAFKNPKLAKEWDYERNYPLVPNSVTEHSGKKAWWVCEKGHSYSQIISNRSYGQRCPYCYGDKVCDDNCLLFINPTLAKEWDYKKNKNLTPRQVLPNSSKKVYWICQIGHRYHASISHRNNGRGCPYCSGAKVCEDNCLASVNPKLSKEWDYENNGKLTPYDVTKGSRKIVSWICKNNHSYSASVLDKSWGRGCPYCSGAKVCEDNCLATLNPNLAKQWHPTKNGKLMPFDITCGSEKKVWWKCMEGHEYDMSVYRKVQGYGCPCCSGKRTCEDNCLATVNLTIASEWDYEINKDLTPHDVTGGSNLKVGWICGKCGYKYAKRVTEQVKFHVCRNCNSLAIKNKELAKQWHPTRNNNLTPYDVSHYSQKKVWWLCKNGHETRSAVAGRSSGNGCCDCNKIELKDGTICDSLPEAYYYLKLKNKNISFDHQVTIGLGRCSCDFYISSKNKYIEVTSFHKNATGYGKKIWPIYLKKILKKKNYITKVLKAKFQFIQLKLTPKQIQFVRENFK